MKILVAEDDEAQLQWLHGKLTGHGHHVWQGEKATTCQRSETSTYWGPGEVTTIGYASSVQFMMAELANCCGGPDSFRGSVSWSLAVGWAMSLDGPQAKERMP
jgi:hypothetical protein